MTLKELLSRIGPGERQAPAAPSSAGRVRRQEIHDAQVRQAEAQVALLAWEWDQRVAEARARLADVEAGRRRAVGEAIARWEAAKAGSPLTLEAEVAPEPDDGAPGGFALDR